MRHVIVVLCVLLGLSMYEVAAADVNGLVAPVRPMRSQPVVNNSKAIKIKDSIHAVSSVENKNIMLVIQSANMARLIPDRKHHGEFKLTLYGVNGVLLYSDRSPIFVGRINNNKFVSFWNDNIRPIASTPLKAALVFKKFSPLSAIGSQNNVFEVAKPSYSPRNKSFSYQVSVNGGFYLKSGVYHDVTVFLTQRLDDNLKMKGLSNPK